MEGRDGANRVGNECICTHTKSSYVETTKELIEIDEMQFGFSKAT